MILERIEVKHFRRVRDADLSLGAGLNVIFGPNDLGKSTLAEAIRAALLVRSTSKEAEGFVPWDAPESKPMVRLTFREGDGTRWRIRKRFGSTGGAGALLERAEGDEWITAAKGRHADGELREKLRWGIPAPGGRGGPRGMPDTFLARALLGQQGETTTLFDASVSDDPSSSGREWLEETVASYARDDAFDAVLERARAEAARAFLPNGKRSAAAGSPFRVAADRVKARLEEERLARRALEEAEHTHEALADAREALVRAERRRLDASETAERAEALAHHRALRALDESIAEAEATEAARAARAAEAREAADARERARRELETLRARAETLSAQLASARRGRAADSVERAGAAKAKAEERVRLARSRARLVDEAVQLADERALEAKATALRARVAEAADLRERAAARESEAASLEASAGPDPEAVTAVTRAAQELEVARARVSVGLRLSLELAEDVEVEVRLDDEPALFAPTLSAAGRARVVLRREGEVLATLEAQAGDDADHQALVEARDRLAALVEPLLDAHELPDLDALVAAAEAGGERRRAAEERRAEAGRLRERATERDASEALAEVEATLAERRERVSQRAEAERLLDEVESVDALRSESAKALAEAEGALRDAEDTLVRAEATLGALPEAAEAEGDLDVESLEKALEETREAIVATQPMTAAAAEVEADESAREALAELKARRVALMERAPDRPAPSDEDLPEPKAAAEALVAAEAAVRAARETIARLEGRADRQPLAEARAALERAGEATERARAAERETELEYGGYRRLVATLEATAASRGRDLGAALVAPVAARFSALLEAVGGESQRYGALVLDSDASAEGAVVDGELRSLDALSMGTREQLAMLLRLTLAERLGSFLLLDDHLTHTDAARAAAIGELYRDVAEHTQLVVFTCHPERYLRARKSKHVTAIDAEPLLRASHRPTPDR
ncbi:MAG: AAA family ATPase [Deltaproteobacteria bacterium]|nr:AAA family ATPase [Deltaproteobacteria bacterium]